MGSVPISLDRLTAMANGLREMWQKIVVAEFARIWPFPQVSKVWRLRLQTA